MKSNNQALRALVRSVLTESRYTKAPNGSFTFSFPVYGRNDEEITVTATFDPRRPFDVECWQAIDTSSGLEVDIDAVAMQHDLHAKAMDWVSANLDEES